MLAIFQIQYCYFYLLSCCRC